MRREQCWAVRSMSHAISNTKVFEEPEDDILVSKLGSFYDCVDVCARVCVCVCVSGEKQDDFWPHPTKQSFISVSSH